MILGGALITQYKTKEEAEPARFKIFRIGFTENSPVLLNIAGSFRRRTTPFLFYGELALERFYLWPY
jgi:hypothetical protein